MKEKRGGWEAWRYKDRRHVEDAFPQTRGLAVENECVEETLSSVRELSNRTEAKTRRRHGADSLVLEGRNIVGSCGACERLFSVQKLAWLTSVRCIHDLTNGTCSPSPETSHPRTHPPPIPVHFFQRSGEFSSDVTRCVLASRHVLAEQGCAFEDPQNGGVNGTGDHEPPRRSLQSNLNEVERADWADSRSFDDS